MRELRVAFIGVGRPWRSAGATGFGMAYEHAAGYRALDGVELVACADLAPECGTAFADRFGVPSVYTDYHRMLKEQRPDIVSICTWPKLHAGMAIDCARAGVKAVHCEKPMALTYGESVRMTTEARRHRCRLTFNHQRRFGAPYRAMRDLARSGRLGAITRLEGFCPNFYDWGTHWVDMLNMFNGETDATWVIGQLDWTRGSLVFGAPCDNQGVFHIGYANGAEGLVLTGPGGSRRDDTALRITGTAGTAELHWSEPIVRVIRNGRRTSVRVENELHGGTAIAKGIADIVKALRTGGRSELCAENALRATQIIFAGYESSRRRARVDLPLTIQDNPLAAMIAAGQVKAAKKTSAR